MTATIAWLEDDTDVIDELVRPLEAKGHTLIRLRTVKEAEDAIETLRTCDLILLDAILPLGGSASRFGMYAGFELLSELRERGITTPVMVLTVVVQRELLTQMRELDIVDLVSKPVLPSILLDRVAIALRKGRKQ